MKADMLKSLLSGADKLLTKDGIRRIMLVLIPSVVAFVLVASIVSGSARRGFEESTRDAGSRMAAMGRVAQALRDADDPFETLPGYAKGGRASMTLRFVASDWDRSAGNDLLGILDRQGWVWNGYANAYCRDDAALEISRGGDQVSVIMSYTNLSIAMCKR
jgi:hypothetical protein